MRTASHHQIELAGRRVDYRVVASRAALKLRVRVSLNGVEVVQPVGRTTGDVLSFLHANGPWIIDQLRRTERLQKIRVPERRKGELLYRGEERTPVRIEDRRDWRQGTRVDFVDGEIVVQRSTSIASPGFTQLGKLAAPRRLAWPSSSILPLLPHVCGRSPARSMSWGSGQSGVTAARNETCRSTGV